MRHIFISYSRQDSEYANRLADAFKARGLPVWIDQRIEYGDNWSDEIFTAIAESAAFVVIMSPASRESKWVRREVAYADEIARRIFPVLLDGDPWPLLLTMQHVDARDGELPSPAFFAGLSELVERMPDPMPDTAAYASHPATMLPPSGDPPPPETERQRKLETAIPACTPVGAESQLRVRISLPDSEGLAAELPDFIPAGDELHTSDVRATGFRIRFTPAEGRLQDGVACVEVVSEDFDINSATNGEAPCGEAQVRLDVPPDADSRTVIFALQPNANTPASGSARVYVRVYQDEKLIAESAVSTRIVTDVDTHPACELWKMALASLAYGAPGLRRADGGTFNPALPPAPQIETTDEVIDRLLGGEEVESQDDLPDIGPAPASPRQTAPPPFPTAPPSLEPSDEGTWHAPSRGFDPDFDEFEPMPTPPPPPAGYNPGELYRGAGYGQYPGQQGYGASQPPGGWAPYPAGVPDERDIHEEAREKAQQHRVLWALVAVMGLQAVLIAVMALALLRRRE